MKHNTALIEEWRSGFASHDETALVPRLDNGWNISYTNPIRPHRPRCVSV